jgi:hypothetical protein
MDVPLPLIDDLEPVVGAALGLEELAAGSPLVEPRPLGLPWANAKEAVPNKMLSVIAACLMTFPFVCKNELFSLWKVPCPIEVGHDADDYVRRAPVPHRDCRVDAGGQRSARRHRGDASASLRRSAMADVARTEDGLDTALPGSLSQLAAARMQVRRASFGDDA